MALVAIDTNLGSTLAGPASHRCFLMDTTGTLYVIYRRFSAEHYLRLATSTDGGSSWSVSDILGPLSSVIHYCAAIDANGTIHLVYSRTGVGSYPDKRSIVYRYYSNGSWSSEQVLHNDASYSCYRPSCQVGPDGTVHVVWERRVRVGNDDHAQVFYKYFDGQWSGDIYTQSSSTGADFSALQLDVSLDGDVFCAVRNNTSAAGKVAFWVYKIVGGEIIEHYKTTCGSDWLDAGIDSGFIQNNIFVVGLWVRTKLNGTYYYFLRRYEIPLSGSVTWSTVIYSTTYEIDYASLVRYGSTYGWVCDRYISGGKINFCDKDGNLIETLAARNSRYLCGFGSLLPRTPVMPGVPRTGTACVFIEYDSPYTMYYSSSSDFAPKWSVYLRAIKNTVASVNKRSIQLTCTTSVSPAVTLLKNVGASASTTFTVKPALSRRIFRTIATKVSVLGTITRSFTLNFTAKVKLYPKAIFTVWAQKVFAAATWVKKTVPVATWVKKTPTTVVWIRRK